MKAFFYFCSGIFFTMWLWDLIFEPGFDLSLLIWAFIFFGVGSWFEKNAPRSTHQRYFEANTEIKTRKSTLSTEELQAEWDAKQDELLEKEKSILKQIDDLEEQLDQDKISQGNFDKKSNALHNKLDKLETSHELAEERFDKKFDYALAKEFDR